MAYRSSSSRSRFESCFDTRCLHYRKKRCSEDSEFADASNGFYFRMVSCLVSNMDLFCWVCMGFFHSYTIGGFYCKSIDASIFVSLDEYVRQLSLRAANLLCGYPAFEDRWEIRSRLLISRLSIVETRRFVEFGCTRRCMPLLRPRNKGNRWNILNRLLRSSSYDELWVDWCRNSATIISNS